MKKTIVLLAMACIAACYASAQHCSTYIPFEKGFSAETQLYLKNGKKNGKNIHTVKDVQSTQDTTTATIEVINIAPNDKPTDSFHYTVACSDGTAKIDTRAIWTGIADEYKGSCFTILSDNLQVGHTFEDCTFSSIRKKAYFETRLYNRKVTALETVTVAAGTFEAFVIEYDMYTLMRQGISAKFDKHHKDWYVPGKGIVRSESFQPSKKYTPGDKPFFYSELTVIKNESDH